MQYTTLGRSDLRVSRIGFGTWQLSGDWGPTDEAAAIAAIRKAVDEGITLFDTAHAYGFGASEELLARASRPQPRKPRRRHERRHSTCRRNQDSRFEPGVDSPGSRSESAGAGHRGDRPLPGPLARPSDAVGGHGGTLADFVTEGKIRHVGVSNFDVGQIAEFSTVLPVETLQPPYSLFRRDVEAEILPYTEKKGIGVLAYGPLADGLLGGLIRPSPRFDAADWRQDSPVFQGASFRRNLEIVAASESYAQQEFGTSVSRLAIAWTLARPGIDATILGTRSSAHVDDAVRATDLQLDDDVLDRIDTIMSEAVSVAWPSPESV